MNALFEQPLPQQTPLPPSLFSHVSVASTCHRDGVQSHHSVVGSSFRVISCHLDYPCVSVDILRTPFTRLPSSEHRGFDRMETESLQTLFAAAYDFLTQVQENP